MSDNTDCPDCGTALAVHTFDCTQEPPRPENGLPTGFIRARAGDRAFVFSTRSVRGMASELRLLDSLLMNQGKSGLVGYERVVAVVLGEEGPWTVIRSCQDFDEKLGAQSLVGKTLLTVQGIMPTAVLDTEDPPQ